MHERANPYKVFRFTNGPWVWVYWHHGRQSWAGEYSLDGIVSVHVFSDNRRNIPSKLRTAIAEKLNPLLKDVRERITGSDPSLELKMREMRLALNYRRGKFSSYGHAK